MTQPLLTLYRDGDTWTGFNPVSGLKVTASPSTDILSYRPPRPELVDINVTDFCSVGCAFCYRGSDTRGEHATLENLATIAQRLGKAGVFEVALGGGEITEHPHFLQMLPLFHEAGLVTNFTTRLPQHVAAQWRRIEPHIGAFAFSTSGPRELKRQAETLRGLPAERINVHVVMGTQSEAQFRATLEEAARHRYRVTLLGYKTTERGGEYRPIPYDWWTGGIALAQERGLALSIDTTLAEQYHQDILAAGVAQEYFHVREGQYSAFIDAVSMTLHASSYAGPSFPFTEDWLETAWPRLVTLTQE
ncbi:radical SAM protein [Deinococcus sp. SL84]|uniref:radical SAM protein n=1 Tax=Deinococcus sp. SL84 TaxID=2994663 RepID=UPI002275E591|nr:radical SAM protein [Deinococcus sp. SL84]MCY1703906.1 radical SAM protein [Deinococcus sp. SL84]